MVEVKSSFLGVKSGEIEVADKKECYCIKTGIKIRDLSPQCVTYLPSWSNICDIFMPEVQYAKRVVVEV